MSKNIDVEARISPYLEEEDLVPLDKPLAKIALDYNKGLRTKEETCRRAYEVLLAHPAARMALEWFAVAVLEDAAAVGVAIHDADPTGEQLALPL
jgi:hypothetical protein